MAIEFYRENSFVWLLTKFAVISFLASFFIMARAPDVKEERMILNGAEAEVVIELLGLAKDKSIRLELLLGSDFHLSKKTGKSVGGKTGLHNIFYYTPKTSKMNSKLEIFSHWLDAETGSLRPVPKYLFSSPFIPAESLKTSSWAPIFKSLKISEKDASRSSQSGFVTLIDRSTGIDSKSLFIVRIQSYWHFVDRVKHDSVKTSKADQALVPGFLVQIGFDKRSAKQRKKVELDYEEWLKQSEELD